MICRTDLSQATLQHCRRVLALSDCPCREEEDRQTDIDEITSYFEDDEYSGEVMTWSGQHGTFQAIVRPRHQVCSELIY